MRFCTLLTAAMMAFLPFTAGGAALAQQAAGAVGKSASAAASRGNVDNRPPLIGRDRLPTIDPSILGPAAGGVSPGAPGVSPVRSERRAAVRNNRDIGVGIQAFGSARLPYTTARVAVGRLGISDTVQKTPVTSYPYRATGKIWARFGFSWYVCSGSLIGRGLVLTAAHCVFTFGGKNAGWADQIEFEPARHVNGAGSPVTPYGSWSFKHVAVPRPWFDGTDTCDPIGPGIICNNDLALVVLNRDARNRRAGNVLGWYRYGWNAYSHVRSPDLGNKHVAQITQLGYPVAFDFGDQMQRTDAVGYYYQSGDLKNTHLGTAQSAGSSGGPWIVNFGTRPAFTGGDDLGAEARQAIVGVTSWGFVDFAPNKQGASFFGQNKEYPARDYGGRGAGNIGFLVNSICKQPRFAPECF